MSLYNNHGPFTSQIEMWSPSTSTNNIQLNITPTLFSATPDSYSRFYHHEPVFYPAGCMICGLSHYPIVSHTEKEYSPTLTHTAITTPAPTPLSTKRKRRFINQSKKHKPIIQSIRVAMRKLLKACHNFAFKPFSIKNHNVYPAHQRNYIMESKQGK